MSVTPGCDTSARPHRQDSALFPFIAQFERAAGVERAPSTCLVELAECKRLRRAFGISSLTNAADFRPDLECLPPGSFVLGGSDVIAAEMKEVVDLIVGREEALRLASRFELLHLPLSSARRLVRILGSVVQSLCTGDAQCSA